MIQFYKALADETRLKLVAIMSLGEFSVQEITQILDMGQSRISRHLKILADAGISDHRRHGAKVFYQLASDPESLQTILTQNTVEWVKMDDEWPELHKNVEVVLEQRRKQSRLYFAQKGQDWSYLLENVIDKDIFFNALRNAVNGMTNLAELGCGSGLVMQELKSVVPRIIGVDYSDSKLDQARDYLADLLAQRQIELRLGAIEHLPMRDGEVDGALMTLVLHHMAEPGNAFIEINRVLKPGGRLIVIEYKKHDRNEFNTGEMSDYWLGFNARELKNWMRLAGFNEIAVTAFPGGKNDIELIIAHGRRPQS